jgi:hypothetical protein
VSDDLCTTRYEGHAHGRCGSCEAWYSVTSLSHFRGTRLTLDRLAAVLEYYSEERHTKAVRSLDVASHCKVFRKAADRVLARLRQLEAEAGMRQSQALMLEGDAEVDGHGVRACWVSKKNKGFEKEVREAQARNPDRRPKAGHWIATGQFFRKFIWKIQYKNLDLKGGVQGPGRGCPPEPPL